MIIIIPILLSRMSWHNLLSESTVQNWDNVLTTYCSLPVLCLFRIKSLPGKVSYWPIFIYTGKEKPWTFLHAAKKRTDISNLYMYIMMPQIVRTKNVVQQSEVKYVLYKTNAAYDLQFSCETFSSFLCSYMMLIPHAKFFLTLKPMFISQ